MSLVEMRHENRHAAFEDTSLEVKAGALFALSAVLAAPVDQRGERGTRKRNDHCSYQGG
jgi:hypothetical protein